jgi:hypothetical protein
MSSLFRRHVPPTAARLTGALPRFFRQTRAIHTLNSTGTVEVPGAPMPSRLLFAPLLAAVLAVSFACGGDGGGGDDDGDTGASLTTPTPFSNDPSVSPSLTGPASLYSISQDDLGPGYITDISETFVLDADAYGDTEPLKADGGPGKLREWGYQAGYETGYTPEGRQTAVLNGSYYIQVETHLMDDEAGASALFDYFNEFLAGTVAESVTVNAIGNESAAWRFIDPAHPVGDSNVPSEAHRYIFRRGNLVAVVLTWGAEPFMDVNTVYALAHIVDAKAMGEIALFEPTPVFTATGN